MTRRRSGAADRVRERREHAARARVEPAERDRHPPRDRREPRPAGAPARHRIAADLAPRRGRRHAARVVADVGRRLARACRCRFRSPSICASTRACWRSRSARRFFAGLIAGLAPAIQASKPNVTADLRGEAIAPHAAGRRWTLRDALVAGQMAVTALLLVVAALLTRSFMAAQRTSAGLRGRTGSRSCRPTRRCCGIRTSAAASSTNRRSHASRRFPAWSRRRSRRGCRCR